MKTKWVIENDWPIEIDLHWVEDEGEGSYWCEEVDRYYAPKETYSTFVEAIEFIREDAIHNKLMAHEQISFLKRRIDNYQASIDNELKYIQELEELQYRIAESMNIRGALK